MGKEAVEFKVGDKVRIIKNGADYTSISIGQIGEIVDFGYITANVKLKRRGKSQNPLAFYPEELEYAVFYLNEQKLKKVLKL